MKTRFFQAALSAAMTIVLVMAISAMGAVANQAMAVKPASADGMGGILGESQYAPLLTGTVRYTSSLAYSPAASVQGWGSVQIMLSSVVTATQIVTVTPQFSLQGVACSAITQWFTATKYLYYQPYSIATSSTTITETIGAWQATPVIEQFVQTGSGANSREISIGGQCMRVQLQFSNPGQSYTPTLVIRALDRY